MTQWQPIETAPKDGTRVLLFTRWLGDGQYHCPPFDDVQIGLWDRDEWELINIGDPTHWMPLPSPPERNAP